MLRLGIPREARWIEIGEGVRLRVRPATTALVVTARMRASRQLEQMRKAAEDAQAAGLPFEGPSPDDRDAAGGWAFALMALNLAREVVEDWEGVGDADGNPVPFALEGLGEVLAHANLAESFFGQVMAGPDALDAEKNG